MIEIPRSIAINVWKLLLGSLLIASGVAMWCDAHEGALALALSIPGVLLVASNLRLALVHPPQLRATASGVAFAGGAVIPWPAIASIYESSVWIRSSGLAGRSQAIGFSFRRRRTLLRVPSTLWLSSITLGNVRVSLYASSEHPQVLIAKLDAMRRRACGDEDGVVAGSHDLPAARVITRP